MLLGAFFASLEAKRTRASRYFFDSPDLLFSRNRSPLLATRPVGPGERAAPRSHLPAAFRESHRRLFWIGCNGFVRGPRWIRSHGRAPARGTAALVADRWAANRGRLLRATAVSLLARGCSGPDCTRGPE